MKAIFILLFAFLGTCANAQQITWGVSFGDIAGDMASIIQTDNYGCMYVAGHAQGTCNFGSSTITSATPFLFVAKYDSNGTNIWATLLTMFNASQNGVVNDLKVNAQKEVLLGGNSGAYGLVVRLDSMGTIQYSYTIPYFAVIQNVEYDMHGNYVASGAYTNTNPRQQFFAKFRAPQDSMLWNVNFTSGSAFSDGSVATTLDGGYLFTSLFSVSTTVKDIYGDSIVVTSAQSILATDRLVSKFDSNGHLKWAKNLNDQFEPGVFFTCDKDKRAFYLLTNGVSRLFKVVKLDSSGSMIWFKTISSFGTTPYQPKMRVFDDHLYFIGGGMDQDFSSTSLGDFSLVRCDTSGNVDGTFKAPYHVQHGTLKKVLLGDIGNIQHNLMLVGGLLDTLSWDNVALSAHPYKDDVFIISGNMDSLFTSVAPSGINEVQTASEITVYPIPANSVLHIKGEAEYSFEITDMVGQSVLKGVVENGLIPVSELQGGLYLLHLNSHEYSSIVKFIKE